MSNILVTGATGHLGKAVIKYLLAKTDAVNVKALVRDTAKAADLAAHGVELRVGDYSDRDALMKAFTGIDKLYLVSGTDIAHREEQQKIAVQAAKDAGVKHIFYTSIQRKEGSKLGPLGILASSHIATEEAIKASGLTYTILLNTLYLDVIPNFAGEQMLQQHAIYFAAGEGKTAFALREDIAEASANILLDDSGNFDNRPIVVTGAEAVSWADIAAHVTDITGEKVEYHSPAVADYKAALASAHVPAEFVAMLGGFAEVTATGEFEEVSSVLEKVLGRKPITVKGFLRSVYGK